MYEHCLFFFEWMAKRLLASCRGQLNVYYYYFFESSFSGHIYSAGRVARWFTASCCRDGSSLRRFRSRKLQRFHFFKELTLARTRRAMPAPVWEGIATQITLLSHPHMAAFILILLVTYMRPSELLALRKKDLVPLLVPLLPCWSIVTAASETAVLFKTGVRDGSVLMDQRWLQWVKKLLPALKAVNPEEKIWNATDTLGPSGTTMYQTRLRGANIDRVRGFRIL